MRIGLVGIGYAEVYGKTIHEIEGVEFAAMCARTPERLEKQLAKYKEEIGATPNTYTSLTAMLEAEKLDGVIISTPSNTHHTLAVECAQAGVNILIDKPVDITEKSIDLIQEAVDKSGVLCGVIYPRRFNDVCNGIKYALENEMLGRLLMCDMRLKWFRDEDYYAKSSWRGTWAGDGGASLMNQGAHPMDLLCWFLGKPVSVIGDSDVLNHNVESEDWTGGVIKFENNVRSVVSTTTCVLPDNDITYIELHGTKGSISLENEEVKSSTVENLETLAPSKFPCPITDFVDAIKNNRPPRISIKEARVSTALINALYQSGREGKRIEL